MRKLIILTTLIVAGMTSYALAAVTGTVSVTVTPNKPKAGSSFAINASGFTSGSGLPKSITITTQPGFTTAVDKRNRADSVATLCTVAQEQSADCPRASQVGQGTANATASTAVPGESVAEAINIAFYLGEAPAGSTCPASVEGVFSSSSLPTEHVIGTLCKYHGGLQLAFDSLPTYSGIIPPGFTATLTKLTLSAGAHTVTTVKTVKKVKQHGKSVKKTIRTKVTNYLLNNPKTCPSSGSWTGSVAIAFSSGTDTQSFTTACQS